MTGLSTTRLLLLTQLGDALTDAGAEVDPPEEPPAAQVNGHRAGTFRVVQMSVTRVLDEDFHDE